MASDEKQLNLDNCNSAKLASANVAIPLEKKTTKIIQIETTTKQSKSRQLCSVRSLDNIQQPKSTFSTRIETETIVQEEKEEQQKQQRPANKSNENNNGNREKSLQQLRRASAAAAETEATEAEQKANSKTKNEQSMFERNKTTKSGIKKRQEERQMFSLKQLARQSRNFATSNNSKKRASIQEIATNTTDCKTIANNNNNNNNNNSFSDGGISSIENQRDNQHEKVLNRTKGSGNYQQQKQLISTKCSSSFSDNSEVSSFNSSSLLSESESERDLSDQDGDNYVGQDGDDNYHCTHSGELINSNEINSSDEEEEDEEKQMKKMSRKQRKRKSCLKRVAAGNSCCGKESCCSKLSSSCEHFNCSNIGPINWHLNERTGERQQITDVDLITYKHLCHLETNSCSQCCQPLQLQSNSSGGSGSGSNSNNNNKSCRCCYLLAANSEINRGKETTCCATLGKFKNNNTKQIETKTNSQQQLTATTTTTLTADNCPYYELCLTREEQLIRSKYAWFPPSLKTLELVDQFFSYFQNEKIPYNKKIPDAKEQNEGQNEEEEELSYRDKQVAFQLPRQDISLDYCSYKLNDQSRTSYEQFVDKRNSQALDVGIVIEFKPNIIQTSNRNSNNNNNSLDRRMSSSLAPTQMQALPHHHHHDQPLVSLQPNQRCRRCLVRFEVGQLAVLASNFIIGTATAASTNTASLGPLGHNLQQQPQQQQLMTNSSALATSLFQVASQVAAQNSNQLAKDQPYPIVESQVHRRASTVSMTIQPTQQLTNDATTSILANTTDPQQQQQQRQTTTTATILDPHQNSNCAMFHPQCFTCSTCKEFLVDLVYCLRENKLYCLRHYGESLRPRCSWCQELIFSDEYLKAMNENFHVDHFVCRHCDSNLAGQRYVLKEEKPYCIQCYEENFANQCEDCGKAIGIDSRDLSYKDRHWHDTCFVCAKCTQSLIDKPFGSKNEKVYCADCYEITFATRCDGCKNPFRAGSKKMEYHGRQWHDSCFCCCVCKNTIGSNSFIPKNDEIYCIKCYEDKYATRCTKCKQVIVSGGVTFRNEPWHRECFNCCNCNKSLAGQRFTTRDTAAAAAAASGANSQQEAAAAATESGRNLNKTNQPHNAYCIDCYGELFAKKCFTCSQAITGLGGTRFVTFEDRSWHNDCFLCNDCQTSLVGKGFITDGPESILCSECARAKLR